LYFQLAIANDDVLICNPPNSEKWKSLRSEENCSNIIREYKKRKGMNGVVKGESKIGPFVMCDVFAVYNVGSCYK
jgi:hypothetical protein